MYILSRIVCLPFFFFKDTATTEIYTLSLHDALPICGLGGPVRRDPRARGRASARRPGARARRHLRSPGDLRGRVAARSEEHTSELQSRQYLVCRLLLEKKKRNKYLIHRCQHPKIRRL